MLHRAIRMLLLATELPNPSPRLTWLPLGASRRVTAVALLAAALGALAAWRVAAASGAGPASVCALLAAYGCLWWDWRRHGARRGRAAVVAIGVPVPAAGATLAGEPLDWVLQFGDGAQRAVRLDRVYLVHPVGVCARFDEPHAPARGIRWPHRSARVEYVSGDALAAGLHRRLRQAALLGAAPFLPLREDTETND